MGSKQLGSNFSQRSQMCSHTPSALNAGAKRSGATCNMAMPQCCYLAKGAKRPSHTTNTIKFDRIPFDPCNSIKKVQPLSFRPEKFHLFTATLVGNSESPFSFSGTSQIVLIKLLLPEKRYRQINRHRQVIIKTVYEA